MSETSQQFANEILKAVFRISAATNTESSNGTCFLIHSQDQQHYFLTAKHVVGENDNFRGELHIIIDTVPRAAEVIKRFDNDVALIRASGFQMGVVPLLLDSKIEQDMPITIYGYPIMAPENKAHRAEILVDTPNESEIWFPTNYSFHLKGLSGGPAVNADGKVVALLSTHNKNNLQSGTIIPTASFMDLLDYSPPVDTLRCFVVLSEAERGVAKGDFDLEVAVRQAVGGQAGLRIDGKAIKPEFAYATDLVATKENYAAVIPILCRAEIVIFDITDYEPAVMLLMGIRSVARRGLTLCSLGDTFSVGDVIDLPFNIKEVNLMYHSLEQNKKQGVTPRQIIRKRIEEGMKQASLPQYLDLPVFDAVRSLPAGHRHPISYKDSILVLCSFSPYYQENNWELFVKNGLAIQESPELNIQRILDITSASRLVSHTIYEYIRRVELCVIDWTEWRPNVFFEMGVRIAVSENSTAIIIEEEHIDLLEQIRADPAVTEDLIEQVRMLPRGHPRFEETARRLKRIAQQGLNLVALFSPYTYKCLFEDSAPYEEIIWRHTQRLTEQTDAASAFQTNKTFDVKHTYEAMNNFIDPNVEVSPLPIFRELMLTAELQDADTTEGISPLIYKSNRQLQELAKQSMIERLLAAWFYLVNRYGENSDENLQQIAQNEKLKDECIRLGSRLASLLKDTEIELAKKIRQDVKRLKGN